MLKVMLRVSESRVHSRDRRSPPGPCISWAFPAGEPGISICESGATPALAYWAKSEDGSAGSLTSLTIPLSTDGRSFARSRAGRYIDCLQSVTPVVCEMSMYTWFEWTPMSMGMGMGMLVDEERKRRRERGIWYWGHILGEGTSHANCLPIRSICPVKTMLIPRLLV